MSYPKRMDRLAAELAHFDLDLMAAGLDLQRQSIAPCFVCGTSEDRTAQCQGCAAAAKADARAERDFYREGNE